MSDKKVILLELNELCPALLEKFMKQGHLPNFSQLYDSANCFITDAECEIDYLEPWIQWVTVHTGLPFEKHKVFRLGQAQNLDQDSIWDILSRNNLTSWICGSMNTKWDVNDINIMVLPDPWSTDVKTSPASLETFYRFIQANVQEHTNENFKLSPLEYVKFLIFMLRHGLTFNSITKIVEALFKQLTKAPDRWKKVMVLDWLQFDVFSYTYKQKRPAFATFFSNSTAHFQHRFWRYMEPEKFSMKPSVAEIEQYGGAILYAYQNHDTLIGKMFDLADKDTIIILSTALSQQPYVKKDAVGGKRFYRPHDMQTLPQIFGLQGVEKVSPVMSHQFNILCATELDATNNYSKLSAVTMNTESLFSLRLAGTEVFGGCRIINQLEGARTIESDGKHLNFFDVFYLADNLKSGNHHPSGVFWTYTPGRKQSLHSQPLPLDQVMGKILSEYNIPATP